MLEIQQLESWLWDAACAIRGPVDAPRFKDYILPLVFLKRLSDVFDDELEQLAEEYGSRETAARQVEWDHKLVRFYIPPEARWDSIRPVTTGLGQSLTDAMRAVARENPKLQGVIDTVDFNATAAGQRILDDPQSFAVFWLLSREGVRDARQVAWQMADARSRYPHWATSEAQERELRRRMTGILLQSGLDPERAPGVVERLLRLLRRET
jgi:hypothetical protein